MDQEGNELYGEEKSETDLLGSLAADLDFSPYEVEEELRREGVFEAADLIRNNFPELLTIEEENMSYQRNRGVQVSS